MDGSGEGGAGPHRGAARYMWLAATLVAATLAPFALFILFVLPPPCCSQGAIFPHPPPGSERLTLTATDERERSARERPAHRAEATVHGLVVDADGQPLEAVLVTTQRIGTQRSAGLATISERSTGTFRLELPPGGWRLYFHRIGYRPAMVRLVIRSAEPVPRLHVRLHDAPRTVAPVSLALAPSEAEAQGALLPSRP